MILTDAGCQKPDIGFAMSDTGFKAFEDLFFRIAKIL